MDYDILVNGERLNASVKKTQTIDRQGAQADDTKFVILNDANINIKKGDSLTLSFGGYKSGKMYIDTISSNATTTLIGAISVPLGAKVKRTRHWLKVRLFDIVNNVAVNCGINVFYQGVENHFYENVTQFQETDLAFLNRLCTREGYALKVDDDRIVIYDKAIMEKAESVLTISQDKVINNLIAFSENPNGVKSVTVKYYDGAKLITSTATKGAIIGEDIIINEYVSEQAEAERFAKGYLDALTQNEVTVDALILINDGVAAGSCIEIKDFARFNGKYLVYECYHDPDNEQTRICGRKIK